MIVHDTKLAKDIFSGSQNECESFVKGVQYGTWKEYYRIYEATKLLILNEDNKKYEVEIR